MDRVYNVTKKRMLHDNFRTVLTLVIVCILVFFGLAGAYQGLLYNANTMGLELVQSTANDEERNIAVYKMLIKMGMAHLEKIKEDDLGEEETKERMLRFFERAADSTGDPDLECYAIIDGKMIASEYSEDFVGYDFLSTEWYRDVSAANGEIIFTSEYTNAENDTNAVIAAAVNSDGDAVMINLKAENFANAHTDLGLPDEGAYYLFDDIGNLLYYNAPFDVDESALEAYAAKICADISSGKISETGDDITDISGVKRGLYHCRVSNGWLCVMTIPHKTLLVGFNRVIWLYIAVFGIFIGVMIFISIHDMRLGHTVVHTSAIMKALCNSFYGIYLISLKNESYEMIKGSADMTAILPRKGSYEEMMKSFLTVVDKGIGEELSAAFSIRHLKELAKKNVKNFGGDFLRELEGQKRWVNASLIIDDDMLGEDEVLLVFRRIDDEKQKQLRHMKLLENAIAAADASERSQKQFFSKMSHEMRTPLNIILGMNELAMSADCTPEKRADYEQKIEYAGKDMLKFINNILEISRIEDGLMPLDRTVFNICDEFENIVKPFSEKAVADGKKYIVKTDVEKTAVSGDTLKLTQILNNILSNADKFTEKGDSITVTLRQAGIDSKNYIFTVEDTGIGMSESFLPMLFDPYVQENRFADHSLTGSGLGMAIVKSIVNQKGGQIQVESELGKGTKVIVTLPFENNISENEVKAAAENTNMKNLRIMVVDDNDLNRELMCDLLDDKGAEVTQASDGKEALELFEKSAPFSFDVIIMDMQMPVMDGCEAAECIRKLDREDAKWVLIIALTANSFSEDVIRTAKAGMDAHLTKPADMKILNDTIGKLIMQRSKGI